MFPSQCSHFWKLANHFPFNDAIELWCEGDPGCAAAKRNALASAIENGEVKYRRSDNKDFEDDIYKLMSRGLILIERQSFYEWVKSVSDRAEQDAFQAKAELNRRAENSYLVIIGAMMDLMMSATYGEAKRYSSIGTKEELITKLTNHYAGTPGLGERTLQEKFAEATRQFINTRNGPQLR